MKKIFAALVFILFFASGIASVAARLVEAAPKYLGSGISLYTNTMKKNFFERTAVFKIDYPDTESIDGVKVEYETVHVKAHCRKKILEFEYFSYFDFEDKWLYGYRNENKYGANYNDYKNGKIFFRALCG